MYKLKRLSDYPEEVRQNEEDISAIIARSTDVNVYLVAEVCNYHFIVVGVCSHESN